MSDDREESPAHLFDSVVGTEQIFQIVSLVSGWIRPTFVVFRTHDAGHPVMDFYCQGIGIGGHDTAYL